MGHEYSGNSYLASISVKQEPQDELPSISVSEKIVQQAQNGKLKPDGFVMEKRVSPRLKDIPVDKRPFYGIVSHRRSRDSKDITATNDPSVTVSEVRLEGLLSGRRFSPRLVGIPPNKRPYYGLVPRRRVRGLQRELATSNGSYGMGKTRAATKKFLQEASKIHAERSLRHKTVNPSLLLYQRSSPRFKCVVQEERSYYGNNHHKQINGSSVYVGSNNDQKKLPHSPNDNTTAKEVVIDWGRASEVFSSLLGLVCMDISHGQEDMPIPVTNMIDPPLAPTGFKYIKSIQVAENVIVPSSAPGCNCKGSCTNSKTCSCARLNGSDFPYVRKDGGRLIESKDVVIECGPGCGCGPNCINRVSQRGIKYQLEVYRTCKKGWAVRSWDFIPSGAFVCEYIGVLTRCADLDNIFENDYIFEIDCWHTMHGIEGRERRQGDMSEHARDLLEKMDVAQKETEFCIDGGSCSNVTRFINHSCDPNLFVQCVLSSHHDIRFARIVLFAADDIPPMQELTYDYGYALDSVIGPNGKIKKLPCYCGTSECRGRLY